MMNLPPSLRFLLPVFLAGTLLSCSTTPPSTKLKGIQISATADANQSTATAIDIVFVYEVNALALLPKTGPDWFERKAALQSGLATAIDVVSLQVPPASLLDVPLPKRYGKAIAVYSYANYLSSKGQPVGNLTPYKTMLIQLGQDNVLYQGN